MTIWLSTFQMAITCVSYFYFEIVTYFNILIFKTFSMIQKGPNLDKVVPLTPIQRSMIPTMGIHLKLLGLAPLHSFTFMPSCSNQGMHWLTFGSFLLSYPKLIVNPRLMSQQKLIGSNMRFHNAIMWESSKKIMD